MELPVAHPGTRRRCPKLGTGIHRLALSTIGRDDSSVVIMLSFVRIGCYMLPAGPSV